MLSSMSFDSIISLFLPRQCIFCRQTVRHKLAMCVPCHKELPILPHHCAICACFLPTSGIPCGKCLRRPPPFQKIYALFPYEPPIVHLILNLKFSRMLNYAQTFGELLAQRIKNDWYENTTLPDLILPVPLHPSRLRSRGFNQALEIARPVAKLLQIPLDLTGIKRNKNTAAQSGLKAAERKENMTRAFKATRDYKGLKIALIDDVVTTGSTINTLAKCLKSNQALSVDVWTICRRG